MSKQNDILGSLLRVLVTVPKDRLGLVSDFSRKLAGSDGSHWEKNGIAFLRKEACWMKGVVSKVKPAPPKLLKLITSVSTIATQQFKAADHFIEGKTIDGVKVGYMSPDFKRLMLPLIEADVPVATIRIHELKKKSKDLGIRTELGDANEDIKLAHFFQVLKAKPTDDKIGSWLVAYIYGSDGNLWAVDGNLCVDGWCLFAGSVGSASGWYASCQFCSR